MTPGSQTRSRRPRGTDWPTSSAATIPTTCSSQDVQVQLASDAEFAVADLTGWVQLAAAAELARRAPSEGVVR